MEVVDVATASSRQLTTDCNCHFSVGFGGHTLSSLARTPPIGAIAPLGAAATLADVEANAGGRPSSQDEPTVGAAAPPGAIKKPGDGVNGSAMRVLDPLVGAVAPPCCNVRRLPIDA